MRSASSSCYSRSSPASRWQPPYSNAPSRSCWLSRFLVSGIAELTVIRSVSQAAAVPGFLLTAVALYTAFALLLEDSRGHEVLPVGRLGPARHATHDNLAF